MAKIDDLATRVAVLENTAKLGGYVVSGVFLLWLAGLSAAIYRISGTVDAIRQAHKDQGQEIVSTLLKPRSEQAEKIAALTLTEDLKQAAAAKRRPNPTKLTELASTLSTSTERPSATTETWQAAATLISYRSAALADFHPPSDTYCLEKPSVFGPPGGGTPGHVRLDIADCTIDLNDLQRFKASGEELSDRRIWPNGPLYLHLNLQHARVIYDPTLPMVPIVSLQCRFCTFSLSVQQRPSRPQEQLVRRLLADSGPIVTINRPGGEATS